MAVIAGEAFESDAWSATRAEGRALEPDERIDWVIGEPGVDPARLEV